MTTHKPIEINNKSSLAEQLRDMLKGGRRKIVSGYPRRAPLQTIEEIRAYLSQQDDIDCLLCGRRMRSLAAHLSKIHRISSDDYKRLYGLPYRQGLTCNEMTGKLRAHGKEIAAAQTGEQFRRFIEARASARKPRTSGLKHLCTTRALRVMVAMPPRPRPFGREDVENIVTKVEAGAMLYHLLREDGQMAPSTFKKLLKEHPDLRARYQAVSGLARRASLVGNTHWKGE